MDLVSEPDFSKRKIKLRMYLLVSYVSYYIFLFILSVGLFFLVDMDYNTSYNTYFTEAMDQVYTIEQISKAIKLEKALKIWYTS